MRRVSTWAAALLLAGGIGCGYMMAHAGSVGDDGRLLRGEVIRAVDGDTLALSVRGMERRVRLHIASAPELRSPAGDDAAAALSRMARGKVALCELRPGTSYGRAVAACTVGGVDLSAALIAAGHACWDFTRDKAGAYRAAWESAVAAGLLPTVCGRNKALADAIAAGRAPGPIREDMR